MATKPTEKKKSYIAFGAEGRNDGCFGIGYSIEEAVKDYEDNASESAVFVFTLSNMMVRQFVPTDKQF